MNYHYPLDESWSKQEIIDVINFYTRIEQAYEQQVKRGEVLEAYRKFKVVVPSKGEEKSYFATFEKASGYKCYSVVKKARDNNQNLIKMN